MGLRRYESKRDFTRTAEPRGRKPRSRGRMFVIQKHAASRLHYDFRLEHDGVLLSWAVPKGPSLDPADKRLAVHVEDHPVEYGSFEGVIPKGQYGGGSVLLWDRGTWIPDGDVSAALRKGHLSFELQGDKLTGGWNLIRLRDRGSGSKGGGAKDNWLLVKRSDSAAKSGGTPISEARPESVASGKKIDDIASGRRPAPSKTKSPRSSDRTAVAVEGARRGPLPGFVPVQLATLVDAAPDGEGWVHEVKFDGYRMLAELDRGRVRWFSRNGRDWSRRFASLSAAVAGLPARRALIDGEVVVLDGHGVSRFQLLQRALSDGESGSFTYFAFDLLHLDGYDLRGCKLVDRKRALETLVSRAGAGPVRFSEHVETRGAPFLRAACEHALEGVVSKRADAAYVPGRSGEWMKAKCGHRQEFVVAGFTQPKGTRAGLGALVLAVREDRRWRYAGRVGSGFDERTLARLRRVLEPLRRDEPPLAKRPSASERRGVAWVEPRVVVEVAFAEWTSDGLLRHATFEGVREDKTAAGVARERTQALPRTEPSRELPVQVRRAATKAARVAAKRSPTRSRAGSSTESVRVAGVHITHPDRVLDAESGVTKLDVARHYERVAALVLPHIADRPLSVLRCPDGFTGGCFFQKHAASFPASVKAISLRDSRGLADYLTVDSVEGLISLVQMNVIELHPWGSRSDRLEKPDRVFFDLDPAAGVAWERVLEAAQILRRVLAGMRIESFVKTTGGKGLHVVVPLARRYSWDEIKSFSRAVAFELARAEPKRYVAVAAKAARTGRIFIDYLRNSRGATAVAPYSVRARAGAPIAVPIAWKSLERLTSGDAFRLQHGETRSRLPAADAWAGFFDSAESLPRPGRGRGDR